MSENINSSENQAIVQETTQVVPEITAAESITLPLEDTKDDFVNDFNDQIINHIKEKGYKSVSDYFKDSSAPANHNEYNIHMPEGVSEPEKYETIIENFKKQLFEAGVPKSSAQELFLKSLNHQQKQAETQLELKQKELDAKNDKILELMKDAFGRDQTKGESIVNDILKEQPELNAEQTIKMAKKIYNVERKFTTEGTVNYINNGSTTFTKQQRIDELLAKGNMKDPYHPDNVEYKRLTQELFK